MKIVQWNNGYTTKTEGEGVEHLLGETCITEQHSVNKISIVVVYMCELTVVRSWSQTVAVGPIDFIRYI